jgi:hypothetical protein
MNAAHSLCTKRFAAYLFLDEQHKELAMKCLVLLVAAVLAPCALSATTRYVGPAGTPGVSYYTSIQAAVDASSAGDTVVVSNGVYASGARVTPGYASSNRVVITKAIHVRSAGGPAGTVIMGQGPFGSNAVRCVRMTAGTLEGFTLSNGYTRLGGQLHTERQSRRQGRRRRKLWHLQQLHLLRQCRGQRWRRALRHTLSLYIGRQHG